MLEGVPMPPASNLMNVLPSSAIKTSPLECTKMADGLLKPEPTVVMLPCGVPSHVRTLFSPVSLTYKLHTWRGMEVPDAVGEVDSENDIECVTDTDGVILGENEIEGALLGEIETEARLLGDTEIEGNLLADRGVTVFVAVRDGVSEVEADGVEVIEGLEE